MIYPGHWTGEVLEELDNELMGERDDGMRVAAYRRALANYNLWRHQDKEKVIPG